MVELVDLPGLHNLHGFSEDERVARHFIETQPVNGLLVLLNATQLERQLALVLQLKALGLPMLLALNMADEAASRGIRIQLETLSEKLALPVCLISAKHGQGVPELRQALTTWLHQYPDTSTAQARVLAEDDNIEQALDTLLAQTVHVPAALSPSRTDRLDHFLLHPWLGLPLFFLIMLAVFQVVYGLGAPLQDGLGWLLDEDGTAHHTGFTGTSMRYSPHNRTAVIALTNRVHPAVRDGIGPWRLSLARALDGHVKA